MLEELTIFPWITAEIKIKLEEELPRYIILAAQTDSAAKTFDWWKQREVELPWWSFCFYHVVLYQSSSAAAERAGSLFHNLFSKGNLQSLEDYIETSMMLQFNYRNSNKEDEL